MISLRIAPSKNEFPIQYAILATSGHNTQGWLFKILGYDIIEIYPGRSRAQPVVNQGDGGL
jgi:hypothetical protein